ncbi:MAG: hypothetical protein ACOYYS_15965 [Chloroflexota bacterium]
MGPRKYSVQTLFLLGLLTLLAPALACNLPSSEETPWAPETPRQYTAETAPIEVYVLIDEAGSVVDFGQNYAYGANARMRYVLRFWDVGNRTAGSYGTATIHKAYTPFAITAINADLEEDLSEAQKSAIYARTDFATTEVKWADLSFNGGPEGGFWGTNPDTGQEILGHMDWRENEWEMHVVFDHGIQQDYLVLGEEPFYNWP